MKFEIFVKKETYCWTLGGLITGTLKAYVNPNAKTLFYVYQNRLVIEIYSENPKEDFEKTVNKVCEILNAIKKEDKTLKEQKTTY